MPPKRNVVSDDENVPAKIWKSNPPGREQKELNGLFEKGSIDGTDTPAKIRSRYHAFRTENTPSGRIVELDGSDGDYPFEPPWESPTQDSDSQIEIRNYPHMVWTNTNHEKQIDMVCVAIPMVAGSRGIRFTILEDGLQLSVEFVWPDAFLTPNDLFCNVTEDDEGTAISMSHPKIYACRNLLAESGLTEKSKPTASFVVKLPLKVQRELGTYDEQGVTVGETKVAMLEFTAYQKKAVIRYADDSIKF
ncbi:hypothetical protein Bhyg_13677 [Pseudolycoriella hygida]|uniref:Uncharacterized protein n=1 Tax=Pseudolycoriella hygida TaxID=35572 RepID=A0A9Q0MP26_9DIPT|nr:hypothetical protein Bhyg_13677 [Pseudolycoriella hygida]